jgi:phosphonate transport system substrate-binding protein
VIRKLFLAAFLAAALLLAACGQTTPAAPDEEAPADAPTAAAEEAPAEDAAANREGWPEVFRIGLFAGDDAGATLTNNQPIADLLEAELGIPVELTTGTSYSAVIEAMRAGRVDAMEVGPFSYVLAVQEAQAEALVVAMYPPDDNRVYDPELAPSYYSVIFTKKGSGIESVDALRGVSFSFVDPASTSGHLAPKTALIKAGIDPDNEMETVFAGSHPTSVLSVWNDNTAAGATYEGNLYRLLDEDQVEFCGFDDGLVGKPRTPEEIQTVFDACPEGSLAILYYSDPIPNTPFAVASSLPESFKQELREILLTTADRPEFIAEYGQWYEYPLEEFGLERLDQYYNSLRDIAQLLELDLNELGG